MKKLILSVMLVAFTVAVQAGDAKTCGDKAAAGCPKKDAVVKSCCPASGEKQAKSCCPKAGDKQAKSCCPKAAKETASKPLPSPKSNS